MKNDETQEIAGHCGANLACQFIDAYKRHNSSANSVPDSVFGLEHQSNVLIQRANQVTGFQCLKLVPKSSALVRQALQFANRKGWNRQSSRRKWCYFNRF